MKKTHTTVGGVSDAGYKKLDLIGWILNAWHFGWLDGYRLAGASR